MNIRVCAVKLWLFLHIAVWTLRPCSTMELFYPESSSIPEAIGTYAHTASVDSATSLENAVVGWEALITERGELRTEYYRRKYFYVHNETQIATARAEAEAAARHDGGTGAATSNGSTSPLLSIHVPGTFPDFPPSEDGCNYNFTAIGDLSFDSGRSPWGSRYYERFDVLAVDSCAGSRTVYMGSQDLEFCSQKWVKPEKPDILIRDNPDPLTRSFNVLVMIRRQETLRPADPVEILADGVYFPATGKMHLMGCTRKNHRPEYDWYANYSDSVPPAAVSPVVYEVTSPEVMDVPGYEVVTDSTPLAPPQSYPDYYFSPWVDPDTIPVPPLNSSTPHDCAISVTLQYPPLHTRWNWDRVLKYDIRSKRAKDDPLYFDPIQRIAFFPYDGHYFLSTDREVDIQPQRRVETGGRILLLVLGLVCLAMQIEHGRNNEEVLPFVSLVMLGIQLANHLSQTSIFKDLQIGAYRGDMFSTHEMYQFPNSVLEYKYYGTMAWSEHVPYQAMAMTAIFMYVWIFHRVGDRRRIMNLRVRRQRPGAKDAPSDWRVMYATLAFFSLLCFLGFFAIGADQYGDIRRALTGMTAEEELRVGGGTYREKWMRSRSFAMSPGVVAPVSELDLELLEALQPTPFVSWRFYELSNAQWSFVNKLTGLVVSFFLVPQLLGNMQWELQGRPLSVWFYVGIPFLQSLPHVFSVAKHFQLLPIFSFYDPYINSTYGIYENPTPWWQIGVVVCSTLQVLVVHSQFSRSLIHASNSKSTPHFQTGDIL